MPMSSLAKIHECDAMMHKYNLVCNITLGLFFIIYLCGALIYRTFPLGESDDYMLPTISLVQHLTDDIRAEDIQAAYKWYPEHKRQWDAWKRGEKSIDQEGKRYTYYFPTYSVMVLPFILLMKCINVSLSYAFPLANVVYWFLGILFFSKLRMPTPLRILSILTLSACPIFFYKAWCLAEVAIASLILYCMAALFAERYRTAMLCYALASTLNITISPFCLFIWCYWGINKNKNFWKPSIFIDIIRRNKKEIIQLLLIQAILFIPVIFNLVRFGRVVAMANMGTLTGIWGRFFAYLFDLNFGLFAYFPILVIGIPLVFIFTRKKLEYLILIFSSLLVMIAYSLMFHINNGGAGIARYVAWSSLFIVCGTLWYTNFIRHARICIYIVLLISFLTTGSIVYCYSLLTDRAPLNFFNMTPIAQYALSTFPSFYNPLFSTFTSRVNHTIGGYNYEEKVPVIYIDKDKFVRKILVDKNSRSYIIGLLVLNEKQRKAVENEFKRLESGKSEFGYINLPDGVILKEFN